MYVYIYIYILLLLIIIILMYMCIYIYIYTHITGLCYISIWPDWYSRKSLITQSTTTTCVPKFVSVPWDYFLKSTICPKSNNNA